MSALATLSIEECVARARATLDTPLTQIATEWKAAHPGRKVIGWYPVYSPVELSHAAGALPLAVIGGGNKIEIANADSRFQSFVCSIVKSTLELAMTGRLAGFDAMLFHSICDPARNLASVFRRNFPDLEMEYLHLPQNLASPGSVPYLEAEYRRVLSTWTRLTGQDAEAALPATIRLYNRIRAGMRALYEIRRASPDKLSTAECYALVRAGTLMPPEEHLGLLTDALAALKNRPGRAKDRIRIVLEGSYCEQPPLELIEVLEEAGCYLVEDDFLLGWRFFQRDIAEDGDPVRALADAYVTRSVYSGIKHDPRENKSQHLLDSAKTHQADAVIILAAKFCEPALFDYALYRKALDGAGIQHLFLEFEEKMWTFEKIRSEVETFVESMLFDDRSPRIAQAAVYPQGATHV